MQMHDIRTVRILVNMKSGLLWSFDALRTAVSEHWDVPGRKVTYQFCKSAEDGTSKALEAVSDGIDLVLVAGGDGTVNTIGCSLIGTDTSIGVIPSGSGNGFARHFGIPLGPDKAVRALADATIKSIDVGKVNGRPFLVTCSMAWDASIVRSFEKSLVRGVLPYIFAGVNEFIQYKAQPVRVSIDGGEPVEYKDPIVFTVANLSQYGGGAVIAPSAQSDDGYLEGILALTRDLPQLLVNFPRLFDGSVDKIRELITFKFKKLTVERDHEADIQVDGELVTSGKSIEIEVIPSALKVLVPVEGRDR
jgi:diacylglycerol kinase (ATP)